MPSSLVYFRSTDTPSRQFLEVLSVSLVYSRSTDTPYRQLLEVLSTSLVYSRSTDTPSRQLLEVLSSSLVYFRSTDTPSRQFLEVLSVSLVYSRSTDTSSRQLRFFSDSRTLCTLATLSRTVNALSQSYIAQTLWNIFPAKISDFLGQILSSSSNVALRVH